MSKEINKMPRRNRLYLNTKAELAIHSAIQEVEKAGASKELTEVVILLTKAKDELSDYIDIKNCDHEYETLDTDGWSSSKCKKCPHTIFKDFN